MSRCHYRIGGKNLCFFYGFYLMYLNASFAACLNVNWSKIFNGCREWQVIKAKKRRLGRAQKTIGDYCLLAGSPVDANAHYSTALELCRLTGDYFWLAGALEGSVCALLVAPLSRIIKFGQCIFQLSSCFIYRKLTLYLFSDVIYLNAFSWFLMANE